MHLLPVLQLKQIFPDKEVVLCTLQLFSTIMAIQSQYKQSLLQVQQTLEWISLKRSKQPKIISITYTHSSHLSECFTSGISDVILDIFLNKTNLNGQNKIDIHSRTNNIVNDTLSACLPSNAPVIEYPLSLV